MKVSVTGNSLAMPDGAGGVTSPCDQVALANVVDIRQTNQAPLYGRMGTARQALLGDVVGEPHQVAAPGSAIGRTMGMRMDTPALAYSRFSGGAAPPQRLACHWSVSRPRAKLP